MIFGIIRHMKIILAFVVGFTVATMFAGNWVFDQDKGTVTDGEFVYSATLKDGGVAIGKIKSCPLEAVCLDFRKPVADAAGKPLKFTEWSAEFAQGIRRLREIHFDTAVPPAGLRQPYLKDVAPWIGVATVIHTDEDIGAWKRLQSGHKAPEKCCFLRRLNTLPEMPKDPAHRIVAHMGGNEFARSNTAGAYKAAVENGVISLECDTQMAPEGYLYLNHDPQKNYAEQTKLKEILPFVQKGIDLQLDCKCRESGEDEQVRILKEDGAHLRGRIIFATWSSKFSKRIHKELPGAVVWMPKMMRKGSKAEDYSNTPLGIAAAVACFNAEGVALQWNPDVCTQEFLEELSRYGVEVDVWTIDDVEEVRLALSRGARWVTTNKPTKMIKSLR